MKKILLILALLPAYCLAQNELKPVSLNIFKNGTYFIVKEGAVSAEKGNWRMESPKNPLLSTFWLTTGKDYKISRVDFKDDTIKINRTIKNWADILPVSKGKKIKIAYVLTNTQNSALRELSGTLLDYYKDNSTIKLSTADGFTMFLTTNQIVELSVEGKTDEKYKTDSLTRVGIVNFNKSGTDIPLKLTYMSTGIQWIPSYNLKVIDDKLIQIEMKALVENFSESLKNVDLTLTVGAPQFKYGSQPDYLALNFYTGTSQTVSYSQGYLYNNSGVPAMQGMYEGMDKNSRTYDWQDFTTYSTDGEKSNDLYKYRIGNVSLAMNTKSSFSIFSASIPYSDIYEVSIGDVVNFAGTRYINNNPDQRYDVYHSFKLMNTTSNPFTTAPAFIQDEKLEPLAQDEIKYTPKGGHVKVQLSRSPDIYVGNTEEQSNKTDNAKTYNKVVYSKVTIKGSIPVENLQDKAISLNISKYINGHILDVSDNGKINIPGKYTGLNPSSNAEWTIELKPNEKKTITYTYEVYVYNY